MLNDLNRFHLAGLVQPAFLIAVCLSTIAYPASLQAQEAAADAEKVTFEDHVLPLLRSRCLACHNPDKKSGSLDVSNFTNLMLGGGSGNVIEPGDSAGSHLYSLVTHEVEPHMPPGNTKIPDAEIAVLQKWIDGGALETKSSKSRAKKKSIGLNAVGNALERPAVIAVLPKLSLEPVLHTKSPGCVTALATSPWSPIVAVAAPHQVLLYDTKTLQPLGVLDFPEGQVNVLQFSRNGQVLLAGGGKDGASGRVVLWEVATGERIAEIGDEVDTVLAADISPDHQFVALGGPQKVVRVYSISDGTLKYDLRKHTEWITSLAFSPDGVLLATGDRNGGVFVWETFTGNQFLELKGHTDRITDMSWRLDGNILATGGQDTTLRLWEVENGGQVKNWGAHGGGLTSVQFTRAGNLVSAGRDRILKLWNQNGEALKQLPPMTDIAVAVAFCDESSRIIGGDWLGQINVWAEADGAVVGSLSNNPPLLADRLQSAQQQFVQANAAHEPVAAELAQLQKTFDELRSALAASTNTRQTVQTAIAQLEQQMMTAQEQLQAKIAQQTAWQVEFDEKTKLKPELQLLAEKAVTVAALSPNDAELQSTSVQLAEKFKQLDARVVELTSAITQTTEMRVVTEQQMKTMTEQLASNRVQVEELNKQIVAMEQQVGTMDATLKVKSTVVAQARQSVEAAQTEVTRWQTEIQFVADLKTLIAERDAAQVVIDQREVSQSGIQSELDAVQARLNAALEATGQATTVKDTVEQQIRELKKIIPPQ
jgi:WD40 repeat protein